MSFFEDLIDLAGGVAKAVAEPITNGIENASWGIADKLDDIAAWLEDDDD